jgi:hypothetical protein
VLLSDLPGVNPATLNEILLYYRLMTKKSGLGDSTELSRVGLSQVPIDYGEVFDKRRPFPNQKGMARALEADFPPEKQAEDSYDLETTSEIFQKLFSDDEVDPEHIAEVKRIMGIKPEASPYARLAEVYAIGSEEEEKTDTTLELRDQWSSMQSLMRHRSPSKCPIF